MTQQWEFGVLVWPCKWDVYESYLKHTGKVVLCSELFPEHKGWGITHLLFSRIMGVR